MPPAPFPETEEERLDALNALGIVGTERSAEFDVFPELATTLFNTPVAAISLIERDRLWFKSSVGLDVTEVPRDVGLCSHTILKPDELLYVPDATKDARFADNPLVVGEFGLRFYAGFPILGPSGHALGAICVIDRQPRVLEDRLLDQLRKLALAIGGAIKLHSSVQSLRKLAISDGLTGLLNRAGFEQRVSKVLAQRMLGPSRMTGLLFLDLDRFKSINDLFGHAGGDAALREVSARLRRVLRGADAVSRFGGDEFCILVEDVQPPQLLDLAERIHLALGQPFTIEQSTVPLRTSIGVALCRGRAIDAKTLIREADGALYMAKRAGRATTKMAAPLPTEADPQTAGRMGLQNLLRTALVPPGNEPFSLALQPLYNGQGDGLAGFEALVRWPQPDGRLIPPGEFIPVAESTGLVVQLDRWVLNEACRLAAAWPKSLQVSSNLSAANFISGDLVNEVCAALQRHGLAPNRLRLEITESVLLQDPVRVQAIMGQLRALGVRFILDDFGSGHASIAYLRDYSFDGLKIDRSFVSAIETDTKNRAFVGAIVDMSRALGLEVTAEGVETPEQLRLLRAKRVTTLQGYLLGRPMSAHDATDLIEWAERTDRVSAPLCDPALV